MNFEKIKQEISISSYLKSIGCKPQFENEHTARYIAPYRADSNPSLSVDISTNLFFDHGLGRGGNLIQLAALINTCSDYEAAKILTESKQSFSFHRKPTLENKTRNVIEIKKIKNLENIALLQYIQSRKIDIVIAQQYCKECYYSVAGKNYFAIVFENDSKSVELRSKYFKGATSKDITTINNNSDTLQIFEGFIDMLSFATYYGQEVMLSLDTIILNSVTNIRKARPRFNNYKKVHLYLDNDSIGKNLTKKLLCEFTHAIDCSHLYRDHKDFNEYLISI